MSFKTIIEECSPKEVAWVYKSFLDDCLPKHLKEAGKGVDSPEIILTRIAKVQKELDYLNDAPLAEQVENHITGYHKWSKDAETRLTDEQKLLREKCNKTIGELNKWQPVSESSKYYKDRLIFLLKDLLSQSLYVMELFVHPETPDAESAEREIINRKKELTEWLENLKREYPIAVEIKKERDFLESTLLQDLELLV